MTDFWWNALKKGGDIVANLTEEIVGDRLKGQIEKRFAPVLKLLEDPEARKAFDKAFGEAAEAFERGAAGTDERQFRREVVALLRRTSARNVESASREVLKHYVLASESDRSELDRWVRRQLAGRQFIHCGRKNILRSRSLGSSRPVF